MGSKRLYSTVYRGLLTVFFTAHGAFACAAVTMAGTRVIYDASAQGESLRFTNHDSAPNVMQVWVDSGNEQSTPRTADAPFVVNPPVFRIAPDANQTVRLVFTGKDLPQDRESVFYLNALQIPSMNAANAGRNQMVVMVRSRLKVFYRPHGIEGNPHRAAEQLSFRTSGAGGATQLSASNASGFYLSIANGSVVCGSHTATIKPVMIAPRSQASLNLQGKCPLDSPAIRANVHYIDDYGAVRDAEFQVAAPGAR